MDSAHVSLIVLLLKSSAFEDFRVDRSMTLGLNLASLQKILKVAGNDDTVTIKANDSDADTVTFIFEHKSMCTQIFIAIIIIILFIPFYPQTKSQNSS